MAHPELVERVAQDSYFPTLLPMEQAVTSVEAVVVVKAHPEDQEEVELEAMGVMAALEQRLPVVAAVERTMLIPVGQVALELLLFMTEQLTHNILPPVNTP